MKRNTAQAFGLLAALVLAGTAPRTAAADLDYRWAHPTPQGNGVFALAFQDDDIGWAVGGGGFVMRSADGGATWDLLQGPDGIALDLNDLFVLPTGTLVAAGCDDYIYRSVDGGTTWSAVPNPAAGELRDVGAYPGGVSAAGENGSVIVSTDDGLTWTEKGPGVGVIRHHLWRSALEGYAVGEQVSHRTVDGGATWTEHFLPIDPLYRYRTIPLDALHWLTVTLFEGGELWETTDAGSTWTQLLDRNVAGFPCLTRLPGGRLLLGSDTGDILRSDDLGRTFQNATTNLCEDALPASITDLLARPDGVLFAANRPSMAGMPPTWLRSDDGGDSWFEPAATRGRSPISPPTG